MAQVRVAAGAVEDLRELILTHELPEDTPQRVARRLRALARFPKLGPVLSDSWAGTRYVLGPWSWLLIVLVVAAGRQVDVASVWTSPFTWAVGGLRSQPGP